ncbi:YafY family protein [Emergencia sp. 1XD21-10]|uniref:helix-turn-helix transcriptional regulator n=1 Tax=Emergencia sp. 1XD21-10 TaxID=2304569 RepID=UPI00137A2D9E|nr:YafY family protein [Emergencia sp. 1XD21-10]NCE97958.1 YafY family transcriptional regulator [Emergencia sp. 1XD21-10]
MKIDRLIGILSVLLRCEQVTAPELAERFEVSRRTINRDIEVLCKAGIPIATSQGSGGGISIMDGYKIDRTLLTTKDMQMILAGLRSLDSVSGSSYYEQLMEKLKPGASSFTCGSDFMLIDLSSWYKETLAPKIQLMQEAISEKRKLTFRYYSPKGEEMRTVEPYYLVFHWSSWYLWAWCEKRQDFRLFKLNRMTYVEKVGECFAGRDVPFPELSNEKIFPGEIKVKALFEAGAKWRLIEEFGVDSFREQEDGRLLFCADYTDKESLLTWLLTFGAQAELLQPEELREELRQIIQKMEEKYNGVHQTD